MKNLENGQCKDFIDKSFFFKDFVDKTFIINNLNLTVLVNHIYMTTHNLCITSTS